MVNFPCLFLLMSWKYLFWPLMFCIILICLSVMLPLNLEFSLRAGTGSIYSFIYSVFIEYQVLSMPYIMLGAGEQ